MRAHPGLVAKIGAEGVLGIGLPDGRGAALKVLDGAMRGARHRRAAACSRSGSGIDARRAAARRLRDAPVLNSRGEQVGRAEATFATPA